jgi:hypothetical protein
MRSRFQRQRIPKPLPPHSSFTICHRKPPVPRSNVHRQPCAPTTAASALLQLLNVPSLHAALYPSVTASAKHMSSSSHLPSHKAGGAPFHALQTHQHPAACVAAHQHTRTLFWARGLPPASLKTLCFVPLPFRNAILPLHGPAVSWTSRCVWLILSTAQRYDEMVVGLTQLYCSFLPLFPSTRLPIPTFHCPTSIFFYTFRFL